MGEKVLFAGAQFGESSKSGTIFHSINIYGAQLGIILGAGNTAMSITQETGMAPEAPTPVQWEETNNLKWT